MSTAVSISPALARDLALSFHHLGVACRDLDAEAASWLSLGYSSVGSRWEDPEQGVSLQFMEGAGPRIELIAPLPGSHVLEPYLRGGAKIYHVGYETLNLARALDGLTRLGRVASAAKPAVAFGGRRVAFVLLRNLLLVELIEKNIP